MATAGTYSSARRLHHATAISATVSLMMGLHPIKSARLCVARLHGENGFKRSHSWRGFALDLSLEITDEMQSEVELAGVAPLEVDEIAYLLALLGQLGSQSVGRRSRLGFEFILGDRGNADCPAWLDAGTCLHLLQRNLGWCPPLCLFSHPVECRPARAAPQPGGWHGP
jgi:hypothetical protein